MAGCPPLQLFENFPDCGNNCPAETVLITERLHDEYGGMLFMKKIIAVFLSAVVLFALAGCGKGQNTPGDTSMPLPDLMDVVTTDLSLEFETANGEIPSDRFSWFFGIDAIDGAEGYSSEALIGSIAHSVALLRVPEGTDAAALADTIQSSVDPRKWICVEAEKTIVKSHGSVILVVLSSADVADTIAANFDAYF